MKEREVDIEAAQKMLETVKQWGLRPEVRDKVAKATDAAENSLLGLVLTGVEAGYWPNTPESNQFLLDKLRIAFQMGYYFSMGALFVDENEQGGKRMTLEEAIEILTEQRDIHIFPTTQQALSLGLEALKRLQDDRLSPRDELDPWASLPSETLPSE